MSRGFNTEIEPHLLKPDQHAVFRYLTYNGNVLTPRKAHEPWSPPETGFWPFIYEGLEDLAFAEVDFGENRGAVKLVHCLDTGSQAMIRDGSGTDAPLALPVPGAPVFAGYGFQYLSGYQGVGDGQTRTYGAAWTDGEPYTPSFGLEHGGIGDVLDVVVDGVYVIFCDDLTGDAPENGDIVTSSAAGTATVRGAWFVTNERLLVVDTTVGTLAAGNALTWDSGATTIVGIAKIGNLWCLAFDSEPPGDLPADGDAVTSVSGGEAVAVGGSWSYTHGPFFIFIKDVTGTFFAHELVSWPSWSSGWPLREEPVSCGVFPVLESPESMPATVTGWLLYRLDDAGIWWRTKTYTDSLEPDTRYDGPMDPYGIVKPMVAPPDAQLVIYHRGSLFLACGRYLYPSELFQYRWFLEEERLDCGATITGLVSRDQYLEVYTTKTVKLVIGDYPDFELRESGLVGGPASRDCVDAAGEGTFFFVWDETTPVLYRFRPGKMEKISSGVHTPWLQAVLSPSGVIVGCDETSVRIARKVATSEGYLCLAYDWRLDEWWEEFFTSQPIAFRYDEETRALVVKGANTLFRKLGTGTADVGWQIELKRTAYLREETTPEYLLFDADGKMVLDVYADGLLKRSAQVQSVGERREVILPDVYAKTHRYVLRGTGTASDTKIRGWSENG